MGTVWKLREVEDQLIEDLEATTVPSQQLANKYGVSRQAIFDFTCRKGITRPKKPERQEPEHTGKKCSICQGLLRIARKPHSDFICYQTLREQLGLQGRELSSHLKLLRGKKLVSQKFGKLFSKRAELAYRIYFKRRLPVTTIGRQVGIKNFPSVIQQHKASGWDVPAPLFKYDGNERRNRLKRRGNSEGLGNAFYLHFVQESLVTKGRQEHRGAFSDAWLLEMVKVLDRESKDRKANPIGRNWLRKPLRFGLLYNKTENEGKNLL